VDKADIIRRVQAQLRGELRGEHLEARSGALRASPPAPAAFAVEADALAVEAGADPLAALAAGVNRSCPVLPYTAGGPITPIQLSGECVAYASPDSTWAVTRDLLDGAERSVLIGIYDFSAGSVKELLLSAARRGVRVTLMLDLEPANGAERAVFDELADAGVRCVVAPACSNPDPGHRYFASSHEKVVVVDERWVMVQSGNYSVNGIPANPEGGGPGFVTGNREMGVAVDSPELARFFAELLLRDIGLAGSEEDGTPLLLAEAATPAVPLFLAAPSRPPLLFRRERLTPAEPIRVTPVLSPENYVEVVGPLLEGARASIHIEQQYIKARQPVTRELLGIIRRRMDQDERLDVRIILGRVFDAGDRRDIQTLADDFGLELGTHVRLINTGHFVHCHNKLVIVDGRHVLLGSQNWSDFAMKRNREASLLFHDFEPLAGYFGRIVAADWDGALAEIPQPVQPGDLFTRAALGSTPLVPLEPGDFVQL
jgi:phosphatidylserine/phosphatidylglycerophosphate/cardiolipin synthase-like enzyme